MFAAGSAIVRSEWRGLPALITKAAAQLASATTAAEVLEACASATFAYDTAKAAARFTRAKQAHDDVLAVVYRAQADALDIEAQAKRRLADEYDAAQERGEVQRPGGDRVSNVPAENNAPTTSDIGLTRKAVHEARQIRDAEAADPGVVRRTVDAAVDRGEEPTRAEVRRAVAPATKRRPIGDDVTACVLDLTRVCRRMASVVVDDRFNGDDVARKHGSDVLRAFSALTAWVDTVAIASAAQSVASRDWWATELTTASETLARLARDIKERS